MDLDEILSTSVEIVRARLSTAKSVSENVFGKEVDNATVIAVYDRLNDQVAELSGGGEEDETPDEE